MRRRELLENKSGGGGGDPTQYLTFRVTRGSLQFRMTGRTSTVYYSTNSGSTWSSMDSSSTAYTPAITEGQTVIWKGSLTPSSSGIGTFSTSGTGMFDVEGNAMSLLFGDNFIEQTDLTGKNDAFFRLFSNCTALTNSDKLVLPATTLASYCYYDMFYGCTSLTTAPELPATTLADSCYYMMFQNCTSLTTAPELPATTLVSSCYYWMFGYCTNLNYIKCLATDISASGCTNGWVNGVAASGTFVKHVSMTSWTTGASGIPNGWTVQDA